MRVGDNYFDVFSLRSISKSIDVRIGKIPRKISPFIYLFMHYHVGQRILKAHISAIRSFQREDRIYRFSY